MKYILFIFVIIHLKVHAQCTCSGTSITVANPDLHGTAADIFNNNIPTSWTAIGFPSTGSSAFQIDCADVLTSSCNGGSFIRGLQTWGISQTIGGLTIGNIYTVTFSQALVLNIGRSTGYVEVTFAGTTLASPDLALPGSDPGQTAWQTVTVGPFTATATSHLLSFVIASNGDGIATGTTPSPCNFLHRASSTDILIDGISICEEVPLAIELINFTANEAEDSRTLLAWQTATETNNAYFTVERSRDGKNFKNIATIPGAGNSTTTKSYQVWDERPDKGLNYYRLKQTDFDGTYSYSSVEVVKIKSEITIYPNPVREQSLHIEAKSPEQLEIVFLNSVGQPVQVSSEITSQTINYQTQALPKGIYYLKIKNENKIIYQKIVIQ